MLYSIFLDQLLWISSWIECSSKNLIKFFIKSSDSKLLKIHIFLKYLFPLNSIWLNFKLIFEFGFAQNISLLVTKFHNSKSTIWFYVNRSYPFNLTYKNKTAFIQSYCKLFIHINIFIFEKFKHNPSKVVFLKNQISIFIKFHFFILTCNFVLYYYRDVRERIQIFDNVWLNNDFIDYTNIEHLSEKWVCSYLSLFNWL